MVFYKMGVLEDEKKPYFKGEKSTKKGYMYSRSKSYLIHNMKKAFIYR